MRETQRESLCRGDLKNTSGAREQTRTFREILADVGERNWGEGTKKVGSDVELLGWRVVSSCADLWRRH